MHEVAKQTKYFKLSTADFFFKSKHIDGTRRIQSNVVSYFLLSL